MTASLAYSATPVAELTGAQLTELSMAPLRELRRLAPGTTRTANRHDVRTGTTTAHSQPDGSVRYLEPARWSHCWGMGDECTCVLEYASKRPQRSIQASQTNSPPPRASMYSPSRCWSLSA
jgi:hypothetical protein